MEFRTIVDIERPAWLVEPAERVLPIELLLIELELPPLFPPNVFVLVRLGVTVPML